MSFGTWFDSPKNKAIVFGTIFLVVGVIAGVVFIPGMMGSSEENVDKRAEEITGNVKHLQEKYGALVAVDKVDMTNAKELEEIKGFETVLKDAKVAKKLDKAVMEKMKAKLALKKKAEAFATKIDQYKKANTTLSEEQKKELLASAEDLRAKVKLSEAMEAFLEPLAPAAIIESPAPLMPTPTPVPMAEPAIVKEVVEPKEKDNKTENNGDPVIDLDILGSDAIGKIETMTKEEIDAMNKKEAAKKAAKKAEGEEKKAKTLAAKGIKKPEDGKKNHKKPKDNKRDDDKPKPDDGKKDLDDKPKSDDDGKKDLDDKPKSDDDGEKNIGRFQAAKKFVWNWTFGWFKNQ